MTQPSTNPRDDAARRKAVRRTALWVAALAVGVYVAFLLAGVLGR